MSQVPALVIAGPGTNRDQDVRQALEMAGANAKIVLASELVERYMKLFVEELSEFSVMIESCGNF